jgi:muramoyltetrapeptide carboxypeptidase
MEPPMLGPGARVALVAPAGPLRGEEDIERAVENARDLGWSAVVGACVRGRRGYLAGGDAERVADLNRAIADPRIDGIWCLRGGYGTMRILGAIDYEALQRHPKAVIGFSDITALHCAIAARCGLISFHGPTARGVLSAFARHSLVRAVVEGRDPCGVAVGAQALRDGQATGRLVGGNLALLAALVGTPFAAQLDGALLVLEDVSEPVYRIDRMLHQLRLAGSLRGVSGLIFGAFTERGGDTNEGDVEDSRLLNDVLLETADALSVPCISGAPVGHIDDQWTLPLGAVAALDARERRVTVRSKK